MLILNIHALRFDQCFICQLDPLLLAFMQSAGRLREDFYGLLSLVLHIFTVVRIPQECSHENFVALTSFESFLYGDPQMLSKFRPDIRCLEQHSSGSLYVNSFYAGDLSVRVRDQA